MFCIPQNQPVTKETVARFIEQHRQRCPAMQRLYDYYLGQHPILLRGRDLRLCNNMLVTNHAKYITDTAVGYLIGNPVQYAGRNDTDLSRLREWMLRADADTQDIDLAKNASIFGRAFEMVYLSGDDNPTPMLANLSPLNAFVVYDSSVENRPVFGVYHYPETDARGVVRHCGYWCGKEEIAEFVYDGKGITITDVQPNRFHEVNIIEYYNNGECQGDFEQVISLIDAYNLLQSDRLNDKEQFVNAILLIKGQVLGDTPDEESEVYHSIRQLGLLSVDTDTDVQWLTRQLDEQSVEILRKAIEGDIHKIANVPCLTDKHFGANASGVAMRYKLLGFEQLTKIKERYFKEGLRLRLQLFLNALSLKGYAAPGLSDIEIAFVRSLPVNELEIAQTISMLKDMVPLEMLLRLLPFVRDPAAAAKSNTKGKGEQDGEG